MHAEIPDHTKEALVRYRDHHIAPGGFLMAMLTGDYHGAFLSADTENLGKIGYIFYWIRENLGADIQGSRSVVDGWLMGRTNNENKG